MKISIGTHGEITNVTKEHNFEASIDTKIRPTDLWAESLEIFISDGNLLKSSATIRINKSGKITSITKNNKGVE